MKIIKHLSFVVAMVAVFASGAVARAAGSGLPGDDGKPGLDGILPVNASPRVSPPGPAAGPAMELALEAARAVVAGCKQFHLGVSVVNSAGAPILIYVPDGSSSGHSFMSLRKAYSAITFKANTSTMVTRAQQDSAIAAQVKADPNLIAYGGGVLLEVGGRIVGAIGVSGAEPGAHDEECAMIGVNEIRNQLK